MATHLPLIHGTGLMGNHLHLEGLSWEQLLNIKRWTDSHLYSSVKGTQWDYLLLQFHVVHLFTSLSKAVSLCFMQKAGFIINQRLRNKLDFRNALR